LLPKARGELAGTGPGQRSKRGRWRQRQSGSPRTFRVGDAGRIAMEHSLDHLVIGQARLQHETIAPAAATKAPRRVRQQRQRLLGCAIPRSQQLLVEVEKRDDFRVVDTMQHCLGADDRARGRQVAVTLAGDLRDGPAEYRFEFLARSGDANPK
jgi:hypothetical protein